MVEKGGRRNGKRGFTQGFTRHLFEKMFHCTLLYRFVSQTGTVLDGSGVFQGGRLPGSLGAMVMLYQEISDFFPSKRSIYHDFRILYTPPPKMPHEIALMFGSHSVITVMSVSLRLFFEISRSLSPQSKSIDWNQYLAESQYWQYPEG